MNIREFTKLCADNLLPALLVKPVVFAKPSIASSDRLFSI
jgi:hypothetical protein